MDAKGWIALVSLIVAVVAVVLTFLSRRDAKRAAAAANNDAAAAAASAARAAAAAERMAAASEQSIAFAREQFDSRPWLVEQGRGSIGFRLTNNTPRQAYEVQISGGPVRDLQFFTEIGGLEEVAFTAVLAPTQGLGTEPFTVQWRTEPSGLPKSATLHLPPR